MFTLRRVRDVPPVHIRHVSDFTKVLRKATATKPDTAKVLSLRKVGRAMIDAMKDDNKSGRKHTYRRDGPVKRLKERLENPKMLSQEKKQFFSGHVLEDVTMDDLLERSTSARPQPGAFVEIRRNDIVTNGVIISTQVQEDESDTLTLTTTGEYWAHRSTDIMFAVPDFVKVSLIEQCGATNPHANALELSARLKVLKQARDFERAVEQAQHGVARFIKDLYSHVRAESEDEWGRVSTLDAARRYDPDPASPIVTLFAVHKQLMECCMEYQCQPLSHWMVHQFDVRPLSHLQNLRRVLEWIRTKEPCIQDFQQKVKVIIDASRKVSQESIDELPSRVPYADVPDVKWTPKDHELIKVLKLSLGRGRKIQRNPYDGVIPAIVKATTKYEEECTLSTAFKFLQEIGVYTPWEDMPSKDRELNLTQEPVEKTVTQGPLSGLISDPHDSVRHDFGDLPVYVIDDFSAEELDDGVSIEQIPDEPGSVWIHNHIADPTAILPLEHEITRQARAIKQNAYFIHRTWPMLPRELSEMCDMGSSSKEGQRVLTFSAKIDVKGDLLDYAIKPGIVRNVKLLKYDDVDRVLGERSADYVFFPFGHSVELENQKNRDVSHILPFADELKALYATTRRVVERRNEIGMVSFSWPHPELTMRPKPVPFNPLDADTPILYRGFPEIMYTVETHLHGETGARSLVAECMKLACRIASRFGVDNDIPLIRRGVPPVEFANDAVRERMLAARDKAGYVDAVLALRENIVFGPATATLEPAPHWAMGLGPGDGGYTRATSPLRRFVDMMMHWQIKSALLPRSDAAYGRPPFSAESLQEVVSTTALSDLSVKRAERAHLRYWSHMYIRRWLARARTQGRGQRSSSSGSDSEYVLHPRQALEAIVTRPVTVDLMRKQPFLEVFLPKLGMFALLNVASLEYTKEIGDRIRVRIVEIEMLDLNPNMRVKLA